jgi:hypothetical protein
MEMPAREGAFVMAESVRAALGAVAQLGKAYTLRV